jgi:hypothetical protein
MDYFSRGCVEAVASAVCLAVGAAFADEQRTSVQMPDTVQSITFPNGNTVEVKTGVKVEVVERKADAPKVARRTAIFVNNRAGESLNETVLRLEDHVAARLAGDRFSVISREDVLKALNVYPVNGGAAAKALADGERNALGSAEDRAMSDSTSALRLAQNIGADSLLMVAIDSFNSESKHFKTGDIDVQNRVFTLRGTYKLLDGVTGGALCGQAVRASRVIRESPNLTVENTDLTAELIEQLADQIADDLLKRTLDVREVPDAAANAAPAPATSEVPVTIRCQARDLQGNEISLSDIAMTEDNLVQKGTNLVSLQVSALIVINGVALSSTPSTLMMHPGLHRLRLTRPGFDDVEMTIKAYAGMDMTVTMQMSAEGFARWQKIRESLNALDASRKLTDAEADRLRGLGQMFRQSGYRLDVKEDVKVDAKELPAVKLYRSIL